MLTLWWVPLQPPKGPPQPVQVPLELPLPEGPPPGWQPNPRPEDAEDGPGVIIIPLLDPEDGS